MTGSEAYIAYKYKINLRPRLIFTNLLNLFLGVTFCTALSNYEPLIAHNVDESSDDFEILTNSICDFLMRGHCADEVKEMLDDDQKNPYDIEKLTLQIQELLNKQCSKDNVINIITNNKESEEFYGRINFWTRITARYFILKTLISLVITIILLYLLYRWFKFEIPWFNSKNQPCGQEDGNKQESRNTQKSRNTQESGNEQKTDKRQKSGENKSCHNSENFKAVESESDKDKAQHASEAQIKQSNSNTVQNMQEIQQSSQEKLTSTMQSDVQVEQQESPTKLCDGFCKGDEQSEDREKLDESGTIDIKLKSNMLDINLKNLITKQIAWAKRIGLDLTQVQSNTAEANLEEEYKNCLDKSVSEKMLQQLEYAKSIGLLPLNVK